MCLSVRLGAVRASLGCIVGYSCGWGLFSGNRQQSTVAMKLSKICVTADRGASRAAEVLDRVHGQGPGRQSGEGCGQPTVSRLPMCLSHLQIWLLCQHGAHYEDTGEICCTPRQCQLQCSLCMQVISYAMITSHVELFDFECNMTVEISCTSARTHARTHAPVSPASMSKTCSMFLSSN